MRGRLVQSSQYSTRSILCMVGIVLCVVVTILYSASYLPNRNHGEVSPQIVSSEELHERWVRDVHVILDGLGKTATSDEIEVAKNALLQLRVSSQDKEMHLSMVLALIAWQQGKLDAMQRMVDILVTI